MSAESTVLEWLNTAVTALGGSDRAGQQEMAVEVARALRDKTHLLAQAGTGTGKSLAYLIPAIYHSLKAENPVVIATATLALQAQIINRDAPRTVEALADILPEPVDIALLKGRGNYLCKNRLNGGMAAEEDGATEPLFGSGEVQQPGSDLGAHILRIRKWAEETATGDRDDLTPGVPDAAWRQVSVSARECMGASQCPFAEECFSELARKKAGDSHVIITNHAMLALAAFENLQVLPEFDAVIVDEAHELADRVTSAVTGNLSGAAVRAVVTLARKQVSGSTPTQLDELTEAADALDAALVSTPNGWMHRGLNEAQKLALNRVRSASRNLLSELKEHSTTVADKKSEAIDSSVGGVHLVRTRISEVLEVSERILNNSVEHPQVIWAHRPTALQPGVGYVTVDPDGPPGLHVAPMFIGGRLRESLFTEATCVLTSATLTVGGSFIPMATTLGLSGSQAPEYKALDVGSPFNYPSQGILYAAKDLPKPGPKLSTESLDRLEALLQASQGGALCLYSSKNAAREAAEEMRERLGTQFQILAQGDSTLSGLVDEFARDENGCLFGTMSLWQGVDVPGNSLRLVTIDRIPFPRPDDPLTTARTQWANQHKRNGFMEVSATQAAVKLAQGVGRLIRSGKDRGVVAVLDSRFATAGYGGFLRSSLPDFWHTTDLATVTGALGRLAEAD